MDNIQCKTELPSRGTYLGHNYGLAGTTQNSGKTNAKSMTQEGPNPYTGPYCSAQPHGRQAEHEPAVWCDSTECQQHNWAAAATSSLREGISAFDLALTAHHLEGTFCLIQLWYKTYVDKLDHIPPRRLGLQQISF